MQYKAQIKQSMSEGQPRTKATFSQPLDPSSETIKSIMSQIEAQQQAIYNLLSKYKETVPEDPSGVEQKNRIQQKRTISKDSRGNKNMYKIKSSDNKSKNIRNTISYDKKQPTSNISQRQVMNNQISRLKLPQLHKNKYKPKGNPKSKQQLQYDRASRNYNQNVIQFYDNLGTQGRNGDKQTNIISANKVSDKNSQIRSKYERKKKNKDYSINLQLPNGISNVKQDNIFDFNSYENEDLQFGFQHQIAKPISIRPYTDFNKLYEQNSKGKSRVDKKQQEEGDKATDVPMNYYVRVFNQKLKEQCHEQINYLYFSRADESQSNKQWAEQILRMFQKHDAQLEDMHKSMRYLQVFDEGFFTAGVYQTNQFNIKK